MLGLIAGLASSPFFAWGSARALQHYHWKAGISRVVTIFFLTAILSSALGYGVARLVTSPGKISTQAVLGANISSVISDEWACFKNPNSQSCLYFIHLSRHPGTLIHWLVTPHHLG